MRKSSERHPLAVLRRIIGLSQQEFAQYIGMGESTIAKIESLKLELSIENAMMIARNTGCSSTWLMTGDPKAPPMTSVKLPSESEGKPEKDDSEQSPFTLNVFQHVQTCIRIGAPVDHTEVPDFMVIADSLQMILRALHRADKRRDTSYALAKLFQLSKEFTKTLGITDPLTESYVSYQDNVLRTIGQLTEIEMKS
ncbi:MAG: helix-turn-helix domain-containing protein [Puniceicoccaceae bacterium]